MTKVNESTSLLAYVIAYLQEENTRLNRLWRTVTVENSLMIQKWVQEAIDAYAGGAR